MNTRQMTRALSWAFPLVLWLGGTTLAQKGFFEIAGPLFDPPGFNGRSLSANGLILYLSAELDGGLGGVDIWIARRESTIDENGDPVPFTGPFENLAEVNSPFSDASPAISANGKRLYFMRATGGGETRELWVASREAVEDEDGKRIPFGEPEILEELNGPLSDNVPSISGDERFIFFESNRTGELFGWDIWMASREAVDDEAGNWIRFDEAVPVAEVNSGQNELSPAISPDGLTLFFSRVADLNDHADIYVARRARTEDENGDPVPFDAPEKLGPPLNTLDHDWFAITWDWPKCGAQVGYGRGWPEIDVYLAVWHPDCNGNGQDDCEDIEDGVAVDANGNGIPDECEPGDRFLRGDSNGDGQVNITDASFALMWLFAGGPDPDCLAALNTNGDDKVDIADATYLLNYLFSGGPAPAAPFPECGPGMLPADEALGCVTPPPGCNSVP